MESDILCNSDIRKYSKYTTSLYLFVIGAYIVSKNFPLYRVVRIESFCEPAFIFVLMFMSIQLLISLSLLIGGENTLSKAIVNLINTGALIFFVKVLGINFYYNKPIGFYIGMAVCMGMIMAIFFSFFLFLFQVFNLIISSGLKTSSTSIEKFELLFRNIMEDDEMMDSYFDDIEGDEDG